MSPKIVVVRNKKFKPRQRHHVSCRRVGHAGVASEGTFAIKFYPAVFPSHASGKTTKRIMSRDFNNSFHLTHGTRGATSDLYAPVQKAPWGGGNSRGHESSAHMPDFSSRLAAPHYE